MRKFLIKAFGCKVNQYQSEKILNTLKNNNYIQDNNNPDFAIVFACSVTKEAEKQSINFIKKLKKTIDIVYCTGCINDNNSDGEEILKDFLLESSKFPLKRIRCRPTVMIQNGCDNFCSFCKVNLLRGRSVSREKEDILQEVKYLESSGYNEIVLSGISLGKYKEGFADLLEFLLENTVSVKFRIGSLNPKDINDKFYQVFQQDRICSSLHLSLQSGSQEILYKMRRYYNVEKLKMFLKKSKKYKNLFAFGFDIIAGFPGETEKYFEETIEYIKKVKPTFIHVFPYSQRKGTLSNLYPNQIDENIKKERAKIIRTIGNSLKEQYLETMIGKKTEIIIEKKILRRYIGTLDNYLKAEIDYNNTIKLGTSRTVKLKKIVNNKLFGELIDIDNVKKV